MPGPEKARLLRRIRLWVAFFIVALALSGITAFPLVHELNLLASWFPPEATGNLARWIFRVRDALVATQRAYPFLAYGTDWLAFGHLVIAAFFVGLWRDPVRNVFILHAGLAACAGIIPLAFICGTIREIPIYWRLIDCSFGIFGALPLLYVRSLIRQLEVEPT